MERSARTVTAASPATLHALLRDLERYPEWLDTVRSVEAVSPAPGEDGPAWLVTIAARVGPFRRAKRLRMLRTVDEAPERVGFERRELDGRRHSTWSLDATVAPHADGSEVEVGLRYDGGLWDPILEPVLGQMIENAIPGLQSLAVRTEQMP